MKSHQVAKVGCDDRSVSLGEVAEEDEWLLPEEIENCFEI